MWLRSPCKEHSDRSWECCLKVHAAGRISSEDFKEHGSKNRAYSRAYALWDIYKPYHRLRTTIPHFTLFSCLLYKKSNLRFSTHLHNFTVLVSLKQLTDIPLHQYNILTDSTVLNWILYRCCCATFTHNAKIYGQRSCILGPFGQAAWGLSPFALQQNMLEDDICKRPELEFTTSLWQPYFNITENLQSLVIIHHSVVCLQANHFEN